ncbi:MAG: hypothetical protein D3910_09720 [Candidatus Electrothrix sp. ATG2]|nr:hypothetical protein [Candidatus Electrothrix sp. ATG2]
MKKILKLKLIILAMILFVTPCGYAIEQPVTFFIVKINDDRPIAQRSLLLKYQGKDLKVKTYKMTPNKDHGKFKKMVRREYPFTITNISTDAYFCVNKPSNQCDENTGIKLLRGKTRGIHYANFPPGKGMSIQFHELPPCLNCPYAHAGERCKGPYPLCCSKGESLSCHMELGDEYGTCLKL